QVLPDDRRWPKGPARAHRKLGAPRHRRGQSSPRPGASHLTRSHMHHDEQAKTPMWRRYLRMVRPNPRADLDDELRDHLESTVDALIARGMTPDAARAEAMRRFGDVRQVRANVHRIDA